MIPFPCPVRPVAEREQRPGGMVNVKNEVITLRKKVGRGRDFVFFSITILLLCVIIMITFITRVGFRSGAFRE